MKVFSPSDRQKFDNVYQIKSWTKLLRKLWFWTNSNHNYDNLTLVFVQKCPPHPLINVARQNKACQTWAYQHWLKGGRGKLLECDIEGVVRKVTPAEKFSQPFLSKIV